MKHDTYRELPPIVVILITTAFAVVTFSSTIADEKGQAKDPGKRDEPGKNVEKPDPGGKKPEGGDKRIDPKVNNSKEGKVFKAYDHNKDSFVDDKEMEAMMEGKQNSRGRREIRKSIDRADLNDDEKLDINEFIWWYTVGRRDERAKNRG